MNTKLLIGMSLAMAMAGCASAPTPNAELESARTLVQSAEADPNVAKYAALDLDAAKTQLQIAETAALHHDDADVGQPAYLAAQTARLATLHATAKADDARVAAGQAERNQIQLAARTREADSATVGRDEAAARAATLQAEVDALKAKPTDRGLVLTLGDVLFDTGRAELNPGAARNLDQLARFLNDHPERRIQIDGFTDNVGTEAYNQELSLRRADSVKSALISRGIDPARIGTQGYGKGFPVANNTDSGGRQLNRRVEVVIGADNGSAVSGRTG
jgi:outer membrane protein OmpA-like peptidoglycan-associated protein